MSLVKVDRGRLRGLRHIALDMDGTIYSGITVFAFTNPFLRQLRTLGIGYSFLTNNSSKSVEDYAKHLHRLGIEASIDQIYTSGQASIGYLKRTQPGVRKLFVLGTNSLQREMESAGFVMASDSPEDEPDAVVVGFDTDLSFARLCRAAYWIKMGKPYLATHPDRICPTDLPTVLVDCGAICAALHEATGRRPDAVLGKPEPLMLEGLAERHALVRPAMAMVGDRLYTDVAMARRAGVLGVLVLTGEATMEDVERESQRPDLIVADLAEFGHLLTEARDDATEALPVEKGGA